MNLVVDTNVLFSGIIFYGVPGQIVNLLFDDTFQLVLSEKIIDEYREVISRYAKSQSFDLSLQLEIIDRLISSSLIVDGDDIDTPACRDPDDIKFLQVAIVAKANYLISGDKHLLDVKEYPGGRVLKPQEFLRLI